MNDHRREGSHYYEEYGEYAKTLRIWLVAYGIGVPALIISQEHVFKRVLASGQSTTIAFVFLAGVVLQILSAIIYKAAAWSFHYRTELSQPPREPATWARWLLDHYWPDVVVDLVTIAAFACPTIAVVRILAHR